MFPLSESRTLLMYNWIGDLPIIYFLINSMWSVSHPIDTGEG